MADSSRKGLILITVDDLVTKFLYYDRKEDEDLPHRAIDEAVLIGEITIEEIVAAFEKHLREGLAIIEEK